MRIFLTVDQLREMAARPEGSSFWGRALRSPVRRGTVVAGWSAIAVLCVVVLVAIFPSATSAMDVAAEQVLQAITEDGEHPHLVFIWSHVPDAFVWSWMLFSLCMLLFAIGGFGLLVAMSAFYVVWRWRAWARH